jgi:hypothetical protein
LIKRLLTLLVATLASVHGQSRPINDPIDLNTPRLKSEGVTFWAGKVAYRGGKILSTDFSGKMVKIATTAGELNVAWESLSAETRAKFQTQYEAALAKTVVEAEQAIEQQRSEEERAAGIVPISGKILTIVDEGLLLMDEDGKVFLLTAHPQQASLVDDDFVRCKAKAAGVYKYGSIFGGRRTVRSYRYVRD